MSRNNQSTAIVHLSDRRSRRSVPSADIIGGRRDMVGIRDIVGLRDIVGRLDAMIGNGVQRTTSVQSGTVVERESDDLKRKVLPIPLTTVAAGVTVRIIIAPQELFKAKRLVVDPNIMDDFRIANAKVATRDQFSGAGAVPAALFGPTAFDVNIDWDSCDVGEQIALDVTNTTAGPLNFSGAFLGSSVY